MKKTIFLSCLSAISFLTITGCCKEETVYVDKPTDFVNLAPELKIELEPSPASFINSNFGDLYNRVYTDGRLDSMRTFRTYLFYPMEVDQTVSMGYQKQTDYTYTIETDYPLPISVLPWHKKLVGDSLFFPTYSSVDYVRSGPVGLVTPQNPLTFTGSKPFYYISMDIETLDGYFQQYYRRGQNVNVKITVKDKYNASTTRTLKLSLTN